VALVGVYLNRSGDPGCAHGADAARTEHALDLAGGAENSGIALALNWRVGRSPMPPTTSIRATATAAARRNGSTRRAWRRWASTTALVGDEAAARRRFERSVAARRAAGAGTRRPAWQQALQRARQNAARHEAARLANADSKQFIERAKRAQEQLQHEEQASSRLFAIDVGLDRVALRARYPDRGRFLILRATLRPRLEMREGKTGVAGYVSGSRRRRSTCRTRCARNWNRHCARRGAARIPAPLRGHAGRRPAPGALARGGSLGR
jgi:hypothetical protein